MLKPSSSKQNTICVCRALAHYTHKLYPLIKSMSKNGHGIEKSMYLSIPIHPHYMKCRGCTISVNFRLITEPSEDEGKPRPYYTRVWEGDSPCIVGAHPCGRPRGGVYERTLANACASRSVCSGRPTVTRRKLCIEGFWK